MSSVKFPVTLAVRALRAAGVRFEPHVYAWEAHGGTGHSAAVLGVDEHDVIKTLIFEDERKEPLCVPIYMQQTTTARFQTLTQGQASSPGTYITLEANTFNTAGSRECVYAMNNSFDSGLATSTAPRVHVYTLGTMTPGTPLLGAIDYRVNGATRTLTRNGGGLGNGNFEDFSGANYTAIGSGPDAFVAEALFYDRALSVPERASVEAALESRYAIQ